MVLSPLHHQIKTLIETHDVVLFMEGNAKLPLCGFSGLVVQVLNRLGASFKDVDVLQDQNLRQEIKIFSNWPTIPQLYIKGEFIGGSDIVRELYESGELESLLKGKNLLTHP